MDHRRLKNVSIKLKYLVYSNIYAPTSLSSCASWILGSVLWLLYPWTVGHCPVAQQWSPTPVGFRLMCSLNL